MVAIDWGVISVRKGPVSGMSAIDLSPPNVSDDFDGAVLYGRIYFARDISQISRSDKSIAVPPREDRRYTDSSRSQEMRCRTDFNMHRDDNSPIPIPQDKQRISGGLDMSLEDIYFRYPSNKSQRMLPVG